MFLLETKIPIRPAPAPPKSVKPLSNATFGHLDNTAIFVGNKLSRSQSLGKIGEKKKPPPRPPPPKTVPKLTQNNARKQPTQLLSNLFNRKSGRSKNGNGLAGQLTDSSSLQNAVTVPSGALIDLHSPPSSPTLTTRSSSDCVSIDSFGSDGNAPAINSSGSQVESGFEDDFDFFMASGATTPNAADPWGDLDPFAVPHRTSPHSSVPPTIFELSNEDPRSRHQSLNYSEKISLPPTIIRAKNNKPARPPPPTKVAMPPSHSSQDIEPPLDWSPPMPSCPPPPPPPEVLEVLQNGPKLPPRPTTLLSDGMEKKKPYCIAQYDYEAGHPDDLSFKVNDVIILTDRVNEEWLRGRLKGKEGMFPASFVNVIVPLEDSADGLEHHASVIALYTFKPETWDDLPFQEGDCVRVLRRINDDWLYGECNGRRGQFPSSFVSDVSALFPVTKAGS